MSELAATFEATMTRAEACNLLAALDGKTVELERRLAAAEMALARGWTFGQYEWALAHPDEVDVPLEWEQT